MLGKWLVMEISSVQDHALSEKFGKVVGDNHCLREFDQSTVHPFSNTILWRWYCVSYTNFPISCWWILSHNQFEFPWDFFLEFSNVPNNLLWLVLHPISAWHILSLFATNVSDWNLLLWFGSLRSIFMWYKWLWIFNPCATGVQIGRASCRERV